MLRKQCIHQLRRLFETRASAATARGKSDEGGLAHYRLPEMHDPFDLHDERPCQPWLAENGDKGPDLHTGRPDRMVRCIRHARNMLLWGSSMLLPQRNFVGKGNHAAIF